MSRIEKTTSKMILNAAARAASMESIDPTLDLGAGNSLAAFKTTIEEARARQDAYNTLLSQADEARNLMKVAERKAGAFSKRMLAAVAAQYGLDSNEYEKAGGTRESERKRPSLRPDKDPAALVKAA
ncbi:MAG: hypothetical protein QM715_04135 [Nibricoccus sp.]